MSLIFSPKMKLIRPWTSEEFADMYTNKHSDKQTNKQTGYQYYNIDSITPPSGGYQANLFLFVYPLYATIRAGAGASLTLTLRK